MKSNFNYFYKNYDTIRIILRKIYLYGCYNRNDYKKIVSPRKFDNELKRITMMFNSDKLFQSYKGKSKYTVINYDYFNNNRNILINSYYAKAFKENEFILYFLILQLLNIPNRKMTVNEIEKDLGSYISEIDRATIRNHLEKMLDEGYLSAQINGNKKHYYLSMDILAEFTLEELIEILTAVQFYENTKVLKTPGHYAFETICNYLECKYNFSYKHLDIIFRHNYSHQILDEEILYDILKAIRNKNLISFDYNGSRKEGVSPVKFISEAYYGRQYLIGVEVETGSTCIYRIDKIENFENKSESLWIENDILKYSWCSSISNKEPLEIIIDFCFNEKSENYLIKRLFREKKHGFVEKTDDFYRFSIMISDYIEMIPWLRTFYGSIVSINNSELMKIVKDDIQGMVSNYDIL